MDTVTCTVPNILLGVLDDAGELVVLDETRGVQLLALMMAKEAAAEAKVAA